MLHSVIYSVFVVSVVLCQRSPTISYISQEQIKNIGENVDLTCTVQYVDQYPVQWTHMGKSRDSEGVPISVGSSMILKDSRFKTSFDPAKSSYTLSIKDIQETDNGYYRCQISVSITQKVMAEVELQLRQPPIIFDNSTRSLIVTETQSVTLECYAGGHPQPTISWRRDHNAVLPTGGSIYRGNKLPIKSVSKDHRGTYYCVADNGVGRGARRNIAVEVQFAPVVTAARKRVGQAMQYDMDLECKVEAYPPPAIVWYKDDVPITNNQHYEVSHFTTSDEITFSKIRVITVEKRQYGIYVCRAANILGQSDDKIHLFETVIPMCPPACGPSN